MDLKLAEKVKRGELITVRKKKDETAYDTVYRIAYKLRKNGIPLAAVEGYTRQVLLPHYGLSQNATINIFTPLRRFDVDALKRVSVDSYLDMGNAKRAKRDEWHLPCPKCGGNDRFILARKSDGDMLWCRQCRANEGWMDTIAFIRWLRGMDFNAACRELGGEPGDFIKAPSPRPTTTKPAPAKSAAPTLGERGDCAVWMAKSLAADADNHDELWAYLASRGISQDVGVKARLGWMPQAGRRAGLRTTYYVPAGVVIPCYDSKYHDNTRLRYCKVRNPDGGYRHVKGGKPYPYTMRGGWVSDRRPVLLVENELDALALETVVSHDKDAWQPFQIIAIGGAGLCRNFDLPSHLRYDAFDNDDAGRGASAFWCSKRLMDAYPDKNDPGDLSLGEKLQMLSVFIKRLALLPAEPWRADYAEKI